MPLVCDSEETNSNPSSVIHLSIRHFSPRPSLSNSALLSSVLATLFDLFFCCLCFFFRPSHLVIPQNTHLLQAWQDLFPPERLPLSTLELFPPHIIAPSPSVDRRLVLGKEKKKKHGTVRGQGYCGEMSCPQLYVSVIK